MSYIVIQITLFSWSMDGSGKQTRTMFKIFQNSLAVSPPYLHVRTLIKLLRLAKKKEKAEAKKRELEAAHKLEEERLLAKHKVH